MDSTWHETTSACDGPEFASFVNYACLEAALRERSLGRFPNSL